MPCVGSFLSISLLFAGSRFAGADFSGSVCIDSSHSDWSLWVVTGPDDFPDSLEEFDWPLILDVEAELLLEDDFNPDTTRNAKLCLVQTIIFPSLVHPYEYPCSEQSFPSDRSAGVSSNICTMTFRSRSSAYFCACSFIYTCHSRSPPLWDFWISAKCPCQFIGA